MQGGPCSDSCHGWPRRSVAGSTAFRRRIDGVVVDVAYCPQVFVRALRVFGGDAWVRLKNERLAIWRDAMGPLTCWARCGATRRPQRSAVGRGADHGGPAVAGEAIYTLRRHRWGEDRGMFRREPSGWHPGALLWPHADWGRRLIGLQLGAMTLGALWGHRQAQALPDGAPPECARIAQATQDVAGAPIGRRDWAPRRKRAVGGRRPYCRVHVDGDESRRGTHMPAIASADR